MERSNACNLQCLKLNLFYGAQIVIKNERELDAVTILLTNLRNLT